MWVVGSRTGGDAVFADKEWSETEELAQADRFEDKQDAVLCAATMQATFGGLWVVVKMRVALRW